MLKLIEAIRNWAAYRKTVAELSALPVSAQLDLDIYAGDISKIARNAVYGSKRPYGTPAYRPMVSFLTNPIHA